MAIRQIFRNRHPIFSNKQKTVTVFVDLHFIAGANPSSELGFGFFVLVEVARAERFPEFVDMGSQSLDHCLRDSRIGMHRGSAFFGKTLYELPNLIEAFLRRFGHRFSPSAMAE